MACLAVLHRQVCLNFCIFFRAVDGGQLPMFLSLLGKFPGNTVALWLAKAKLLWSKAISKTFCSSLWSMLFRLINGIKNRNEHKEFITGFKPDCSSRYSVSWLLAITTQDCRQFEERLEQGPWNICGGCFWYIELKLESEEYRVPRSSGQPAFPRGLLRQLIFGHTTLHTHIDHCLAASWATFQTSISEIKEKEICCWQ